MNSYKMVLIAGMGVVLSAVWCGACVTEGQTAPSKLPTTGSGGGHGCLVAGECEELDASQGKTNNTGGGKACVLTPADPTNIPVGYYVCPNGVSFYLECPATGCIRVAPQPKKHLHIDEVEQWIEHPDTVRH